jgi:hypothetical protein
MTIDIDPQEMFMAIETELRAGWVQGKLSGGMNVAGNPSQDPVGVCILGAIGKTINGVVRRAVEAALPQIDPTFTTLNPKLKQMAIQSFTSLYVNKLKPIFEARIMQFVPAGYGSIPGFNDLSSTSKSDVLAIIQAALEEVTRECLSTYDKEAAAEQPAAAVEQTVGVPVRA